MRQFAPLAQPADRERGHREPFQNAFEHATGQRYAELVEAFDRKDPGY